MRPVGCLPVGHAGVAVCCTIRPVLNFPAGSPQLRGRIEGMLACLIAGGRGTVVTAKGVRRRP